MVEEDIVVVEGQPNLLREKGADGVLRCWGEGQKEDHSCHRKDKASGVEQRVLVANSIAENRAKSGLQCLLIGFAERDVVCKILRDGGVGVGGVVPLRVQILEFTCHQDHHAF